MEKDFSSVDSFKYGKRGHYFQNHTSTFSLRDTIKSRRQDRTSAVHIVHDMFNFLKRNDVQDSEPHDDASAFDTLWHNSDLTGLTMGNEQIAEDQYLKNHI